MCSQMSQSFVLATGASSHNACSQTVTLPEAMTHMLLYISLLELASLEETS